MCVQTQVSTSGETRRQCLGGLALRGSLNARIGRDRRLETGIRADPGRESSCE